MIQFDAWLEGAFHHGRGGTIAGIALGCGGRTWSHLLILQWPGCREISRRETSYKVQSPHPINLPSLAGFQHPQRLMASKKKEKKEREKDHHQQNCPSITQIPENMVDILYPNHNIYPWPLQAFYHLRMKNYIQSNFMHPPSSWQSQFYLKVHPKCLLR